MLAVLAPVAHANQGFGYMVKKQDTSKALIIVLQLSVHAVFSINHDDDE